MVSLNLIKVINDNLSVPLTNVCEFKRLLKALKQSRNLTVNYKSCSLLVETVSSCTPDKDIRYLSWIENLIVQNI